MNYSEDMILLAVDFIQNPIVPLSQSHKLIVQSLESLPLLARRIRVFCQG